MKEHILVTGGAGYIGSILVPELLQQGHPVTVVDNFMFKQNSLAHVCNHPHFNVLNGDVRDTELMASVMKKADVIIPLAALVGAPLCAKDPLAASSINKDSVLWLLKYASKSQSILMPTTNSAYGSGGKDHFCDELSPLNPMSLYAKDKVEVEKALLERGNVISFRLATVFGMSPRMRLDLLVNDFTYRALYDRFIVLFESQFRRNYIHVRDVANTFIHALKNFDGMKDNVFNVGLSEANLSKRELCCEIQKHLPDFVSLEAPLGSDPDQRDYIVSNQKLENTGWRPQVSLSEGIVELIKGLGMIKNTLHGNV